MPLNRARPRARAPQPRGTSAAASWPTLLGVVALTGLITVVVWRTGPDGAPNGLVHLYYLPIVYLAAFVGRGAAASAAMLAGLAAGPLMPVAGVIAIGGNAQPVGEWVVRMTLFTVVGVVVAWFAHQQPRSPELVLRDRAFARALRGAVAAGRVTAHFQPVVDLTDGRVIGVEALSRWTDASGRSIPPGEFIPLAERTGVIGLVGSHVLGLAVQQAEDWARAHETGPSMAINVSAAQLSDPAFLVELASVVAASDLDPQSLCLEITETAIIADPRAALETVVAARRMGLAVALDDFGTGQSSLAYLAEFPIDIVKVDKAFVDEVDRDRRVRGLVRAIVDMAEAIGATTVAEGIERPGQLAALRELGCRRGQGYLLGRPTPPDQVDLSPRTFATQVPAQRGVEAQVADPR